MTEYSFQRFLCRFYRLLRLPEEAAVRIAHRFRTIGRDLLRPLTAVSFVAALTVIVCLLMYVGYDNADVDKPTLMHLLYICQGIFILTVVTFALAGTPQGGFMRWAALGVDVLIMATLLHVFFPGCSSLPGAGFLFGRRFFLGAMGLYAVMDICRGIMQLTGRRTNPSLILSASFLFFILAGSFVLMLPRCTNVPIDYVDSLFLASSAVSMTGLTPVDVAVVFTPLGWTVLAVLMQIGALGVLTFTSFFGLFFSGSPNIYNQMLLKDFIYSRSMSALVPMMLYILAFTLSVEAIGAVFIYFTLPPELFAGTGARIGCAAFHAIAGFTNSGLSTIPGGLANHMLFNGTQCFYIVMTLLIAAGGIGFPNLVNFKDAAVHHLRMLRDLVAGRKPRRRVHIYDLNTKLVLVFTGVLFAGGAVVFFILEHNHSLAGMPLGKQITQSIFCSATARSAGFAPVNPSGFLNITLLVLMLLMWIGGASQSMAGGIKVNAFAAAMLNLRALVRGHKGVAAFGRRISSASIRRANGTIVLSVFTILAFTGALLLLEPGLPVKPLLFEGLSAITTNGLSLGITADLGAGSKILLSGAMFLGRVGLLSVLLGLAATSRDLSPLYPQDEIIIS